MGLKNTCLAADGGFSIVDDVTFNGSTTTPIDTRYGGKFKPGLLIAPNGATCGEGPLSESRPA